MKTELSPIHVAFCCDREMIPGLHAAISSLLAHQTAPVILWLGFHGLSANEIQLVRKTASKAYEIHELNIDISPCAGFRGLHGNRTAYARIFLPQHVSTQRLIYLDSDTLCLADLRPLWETDLKGKSAGMVSFGNLRTKGEWHLFNQVGLCPEDFYFNTGVILFDVHAWVAKDCTNRCLEFGNRFPNQLLTADQTCVNGAINSDIFPMEHFWNTARNPRKTISGNKKAAIYHFIGHPKPWDVLAFFIHKSFKTYFAWLKKSAAPRLLFRNHLRVESWQKLRKFWRSYFANLLFKN